MPTIAETIRRLQAAQGTPSQPRPDAGRLGPLADFGSNPGALNAFLYAPDAVPLPAMVVVLHGCTQTAAGYDIGSGWSALAQQHGFAVLFPEQQRANNPQGCFNWFDAADTRRGGGEAESIRQMMAAAVERHGVDPTRVFITGLSAGGAMTAVMLAAHPELFAGGGVIAGLPYGAADTVMAALSRMRNQGHPADGVYAERARAASPHAGRWPRLSVWHGDADHTVHPGNADQLVDQWRGLHGVAVAPDLTETVGGHVRRVWRDAGGVAVVEDYRIAGMGHGTPLATGGPDGCGVAGPHMLEAGISSTRVLASGWGLLGEAASRPAAATQEPAAAAGRAGVSAKPSSVHAVINDALRSAGLLR